MGNWLGRLLRTTPAGASPPAAAAARVPAASPPAESAAAAWHASLDVDGLYASWLLGQPQGAGEAPDGAERAWLDAFATRAAAPSAAALIPRVPAVVPQLLHTLRDPSRPMNVLARQLAQDPVLVAGVLKLARSPFYGLSRPVTSLEQALLVIGQDGLRQMLASLAFKPIVNLQGGEFTGRGAPRVWDQSERCGLACQVLAPTTGASPFEAFLAALLESVGLVVVLRLADQGPPPTASRLSMQACRTLLRHARLLGVTIGRQWSFPDTVTEAVAAREAGQRAEVVGALADLLRMSMDISILRVLADAGVIAADDARLDIAAHPALERCFQMLDAAPA
jgi:HD-like signal output (HDOD) protein